MLLNVSEMTLAGVEMTFLQSQSGGKKQFQSIMSSIIKQKLDN